MKYLESYSKFKIDDILIDIEDILVDLTDIGLFFKIVDKNGVKHGESEKFRFIKGDKPNLEKIQIIIQKDNNTGYYSRTFEFSDLVKETLLRVYQYLREIGYKSIMTTNYSITDKQFFIRPDDKFKYEDGLWIDDKESVINISLLFF